MLPKLFWHTLRKNWSSDKEKFWNSRLKAENLQKLWDYFNSLFKQLKVRTISGNNAFVTFSWIFFTSKKLEQLGFKLEKFIGIQRHAGNVRKLTLISTFVLFFLMVSLAVPQPLQPPQRIWAHCFCPRIFEILFLP